MKERTKEDSKRIKWIKKNKIIIIGILTIISIISLSILLGVFVKDANEVFNYDLASLILTNGLVIVLFFFTYFLIDKKKLEKDKNASRTANLFMIKTYQSCLENLKLLSNQELFEKHIIPKINFNAYDQDNPITMNLKNLPFETQPEVYHLAEQGNVEISELNNYLKIKDDYKKYISMRITFFDVGKSAAANHIEIDELIKNDEVSLIKILNNSIKRLEGEKQWINQKRDLNMI